jgi:outer membrane protein, heavy metal efflux system
VDQARRDLDAARAELAATWGADSPDFERVLNDLSDPTPPPSFEDLVARIGRNPDLARWSDEMELREADLKLQRALRIPDMTAILGFRTTGLDSRRQSGRSFDSSGMFTSTHGEIDYHRDCENSLTFELSIPLPLFDRNQGGIKEAQCGISQAREEKRGAEAKTHTALFAAHTTLDEACNSSVALRDDILLRARSVFDLTQEGYRLGKFGYLDVLDAQRALFDVQMQYLEALRAYHLALADVERLAGAPLPEIQETIKESNPIGEESGHE